MERTRTGSKLACRPALVLFILYGASRASERERDWQHGLQSGDRRGRGASRASEQERDWQHGLQSGTKGDRAPAKHREGDWQHGLQSGDRRGRGISRKESFQRRSILGLKNGYMKDQSWEEKHLRVKKLQMRGETSEELPPEI